MDTSARWFIVQRGVSEPENPKVSQVAIFQHQGVLALLLFTSEEAAIEAIAGLQDVLEKGMTHANRPDPKRMASLLGKLAREGVDFVIVDCHVGTPNLISIEAAIFAFEMAS